MVERKPPAKRKDRRSRSSGSLFPFPYCVGEIHQPLLASCHLENETKQSGLLRVVTFFIFGLDFYFLKRFQKFKMGDTTRVAVQGVIQAHRASLTGIKVCARRKQKVD